MEESKKNKQTTLAGLLRAKKKEEASIVPVGFMDKDSDLAIVENSNYRYALNIRNGYGTIVGAATPVKGNELVSFTLPAGNNTCIGTAEDKTEKTLLYFIYNDADNHSILRYYPYENNKVEKVTQSSVLNFKKEWKIKHAVLIDGELLYWTDGFSEGSTIEGNPPRKLNIKKSNVTNRSLEYEVHTELADLFFAIVPPPGIDVTFRSISNSATTTIPFAALTPHLGNPTAFLTLLKSTIETVFPTWVESVEYCDCKLVVKTTPNSNETVEMVIEGASAWPDLANHMLIVPVDHYPITITGGVINYFLETHHIDLIKKPPTREPQTIYKLDHLVQGNSVNNSMFQFRLRYWYDDEEESAWSAISIFAVPLDLDGNYLDTLNVIEVDYTEDILKLPAWRTMIKKIEIGVREGNIGIFRSVEVIDVCNIGIRRNWMYFYNDRLYAAIPNDGISPDPSLQALKHFDNVPRICGAMEFVTNREGKGRLFLGANLENYDIPSCSELSAVVSTVTDPCFVDITGTVNINHHPWQYHQDGLTWAGATTNANPTDEDRSHNVPGTEGFISSLLDGGGFCLYEHLDGFVVYLAGTDYYGISKNFCTVAQADRDGSFTIKNVPRGKYILRVAGSQCRHDHYLGGNFNLNNGRAWQRTSAPVINCAGQLNSAECLIDLTSASTTFDLDTEPGYGNILIQDFNMAKGSAPVSSWYDPLHYNVAPWGWTSPGCQTGVSQFYVLDNDGKYETNSQLTGMIGVELQQVTFPLDAVAGPSTLYTGASFTKVTDHNGFVWHTWPVDTGVFDYSDGLTPSNPPYVTVADTTDLDSNAGTTTYDMLPYPTHPPAGFGSQQTFLSLLTFAQLNYGFPFDNTGPPDYTPVRFFAESYVVTYPGVIGYPAAYVNMFETFTKNNKTIIQGSVVEGNQNPLALVNILYTRCGRQEQSDYNGNYSIAVYCPYNSYNRTTDTIIPNYKLDKCYEYPPSPLTQTPDISSFGNQYTHNKPYVMTGATGSTISYGFKGAITNNTTYLKAGGVYRLGVVYEDYYGRQSSVVEGKEMRVAFHTEKQSYDYPYTVWSLDGTPPIWAHRYRIVRSKDAYYRTYFQEVTKHVEYIRMTTLDSTPEFTDYSSADATHILLLIDQTFMKSINEDTVNWFVHGEEESGFYPSSRDRLRLILDETGQLVSNDTVYDFEIVGTYFVKSGVATVPPTATFIEDQYYFVIENRDIFREIFPFWLMEFYTPKTSEDIAFYEVGECHDILNPGQASRVHSGTLQNQIIGTQPAQGYFIGGDTYYRKRDFTIGVALSFDFMVENESLTDRFGSINDCIGRVALLAPNFKERFYYNKISYSDLYIPGTTFNGLSSFVPSAMQSTDNRFGIIKNLILVGEVMLAICEVKIQPFYIGKDNVLSLTGATQLGRSNRTMNAANELVQDFGTQHPTSVSKDGNFCYGFDARQGVVWRYATNGLTEISQYRMINEFNAIGKDFHAVSPKHNDVLGIFDREFKCYILTFPELTDDDMDGEGARAAVTISFDELKNGWNTYLSYIPEYYGITGQTFVSFKDGALWRHESNTAAKSNFYGTQYGNEIDIVFNRVPRTTKMFFNIELQSDKLFVCPTITIPANDVYSTGMLSELIANKFKNYEGHWNADFLRDKNDTNKVFRDIVDPATRAVTALLRGRVLRGEVMVIKLSLNTQGEEFNLKRIDVGFAPSEETIK